jgi:uncharacterized protein YjlB
VGVAVGVALGITVAVAVGVAEGITVGVGVDVAVAVAVGDTVGVAVGVGVGDGHPKISIEFVGVVGAYPPASQMRLVPSVSTGKLRRAVVNGKPVDQVPATGS